MSAHLLIKLPSRERPKLLLDRVAKLATLCVDPLNTRILISGDMDDATMTDALIDRLRGFRVHVDVRLGARVSKIEAVNRDLVQEPWDIVLVASDDMVPVLEGYDNEIRKLMALYHPDGDGCLWFSDGRQGRLCTYPIIGRTYFDRDGHVYWPGYASYYADDEQTANAQLRGRMVRSDQVLLRHDHTCFNAAVDDDLYRNNRLAKSRDAALYGRRLKTDFPVQ